MEEIRKTLYTQHFSKQHHRKILEKCNTYEHQYHLIITYKNITTQKSLFKALFKNNNNIITYNYACYNRKGYSKNNSNNTNRHKAKIHTHTLVLAKHELELENIINLSRFRGCDIKLVKVYSHINDLISYIFDGHHTILANSNRYSFYYATCTGKIKAKPLESITTTKNLTLKQQISLLRRFSSITRIRI
ncbi:hypothetical protein DF188_08530 [Aliarcobacter skirrowii]|uniref:Uncharacterized protein n=1 Tax=Aliarcobacter skirrowii TaxID=28200 RepID=A0A2U2BZ67_9BACT|nr:hypothetical protein [Aliarcobacter skirrowii]PWE20210.1 hypothetical protein DF188_08530 [Aliarcobacter skirrowii]